MTKKKQAEQINEKKECSKIKTTTKDEVNTIKKIIPEEPVIGIDQTKPTEECILEEGYLEVLQTIVGKQTFEPKVIKVRPFITTPARVGVHAKRHIPLGPNEGNITVAVDISIPCYVSEIGSVYKQTTELVDKIMERKLKGMNLINA